MLDLNAVPNVAGKNESFRVEVGYQLSGGLFGLAPHLDKMIENLAEVYRGERSGSGSGFGARDITFEFKTHIEALAFIDDFRESDTKPPRLTVYSLTFVDENSDDIDAYRRLEF